jgi:CheY-like chemotaxis protein/HPt (histidine-containing phosphotransfer) domain-containing protein
VPNQDSHTARPLPAVRPPIVVLLVDDQKFVGMAVSRLLAAEQDIELHCCHAAVDAVALATKVLPALILQDLQMPDIDGLTLVGTFRGNPATAATPIVVLSGNDDPVSRARAMAAGATDYMIKLPAQDDLIACIRRHAAGGHVLETEQMYNPVAADPDAEPTLDAGVIAVFLSAISPDFVLRLVDQFTYESALQCGRLRHVDPASRKAAAHSLKGASTTMGARRLAALCVQLEQHLHGERDEAAAIATTAIEEEIVRVGAACATARQEIERLIASPQAAEIVKSSST